MSTSKKLRKPNNNLTQVMGFSPIVPKNYAQTQYLEALRTNDIVFGTGPAGTGKTFIAVSYAAEQLFYKNIDKIVITRPAVEAEETMGHLPGELQEKFAPYLTPIREVLDKQLGKSFVDYCLKAGKIEAVPIAFMRGRTFDNSIVIISEAQNTTPGQMKLILSRFGENSKYIVEGDISQKDIREFSGLEDAIKRLSHISTVEVVQFLVQDIVRSGMCKKIIQTYLE